MEINLNQQCTIVLKSRGVMALYKYYARLGWISPGQHKVGQEYTASLREIMNIFGEYCFMGTEPPFETTMQIDSR